MGPLWAWVVLWLLSIYGLVVLLRIALARLIVEPVPVLVASPGPADPPAQAPPAEETLAPAPAEAPADGAEAAAPEALRGAPDLGDPAAPSPLALSADDLPELPPARLLDADEAGADAPHEPVAGPDPSSDPWIKESEERSFDAPWIEEKEERAFDAPWIKEQESADGEAFPPSEAEAAELPAGGGPWDEEDESIEYRSIDLAELTLGLEASAIQELYGSPGHVSKLGSDGEQWRYPLNATDDHGDGLSGVLVLEFQRGRLVRKALEEGSADGL